MQLIHNVSRPLMFIPRLGAKKTQRFSIAGGKTENLLLSNHFPTFFGKPFFGPLESRLPSLSVGHIGPCATKPLESGLQTFGVPCEVFRVTNTLEI